MIHQVYNTPGFFHGIEKCVGLFRGLYLLGRLLRGTARAPDCSRLETNL